MLILGEDLPRLQIHIIAYQASVSRPAAIAFQDNLWIDRRQKPPGNIRQSMLCKIGFQDL